MVIMRKLLNINLYIRKSKYSDYLYEVKYELKISQNFLSYVIPGKTAVTFQVMHFLRTWLKEHIMKVDKEYMECFKKYGVQ